MGKSHVSMEQHECVACGTRYDTGSILLDRRLKASMEDKTVTGLGLCPEHQKQVDEGYILLVEAEQMHDETRRLGRIAALRAERWGDFFNVSAPPKGVCFAQSEVLDMLSEAVV